MARQTVLLVDADPKSARVLEVSLRNAGYSVTLVISATEALAAIDVATPDLVISDTRLAEPKPVGDYPPLMDGYQLCRRLKDDPVWYSIPFIFLTSSSSIEDKIRGLELGVEDFLTKPIYLREILTRIQLVLAKKQREGMEGRTSRASFTGLLSEMGLIDLLSTIDLGRKSGVLELDTPAGKGVAFFRDGRVVDARAGKLSGARAVYRMLLWTEGSFEIRFGPSTADDVIDISTQGLLMEGMRRIDEWQRMREQLPPMDSIYQVDITEVLVRIGEIPDEINPILRAFDGRRTLLQVVDESGLDDLEAVATLTKLFFEGLIVATPEPQELQANHGEAATRGRETLVGFSTEVTSSQPVDDETGDEAGILGDEKPTVTPVVAPADVAKMERPQALRVEVDLNSNEPLPASTQAAMLPPANAVQTVDRPEQVRAVARLSSPFITPPAQSPSQERPVAKHRGKNRRSKREFADSQSATKSTGTSATTSTTSSVDDDEESESSSASSASSSSSASESSSASSASAMSVGAVVATDSATIVVAAKPIATAADASAVSATAKTTPPSSEGEAAKLSGGTLIQFPGLGKDGVPESKGSSEPVAPVVEAKTDEKTTPVVPEKLDAKPAEKTEAKTVEKPSEKPTEKPAEKPAAKSTDKPAEKSDKAEKADKSATKSDKKSDAKSSEKDKDKSKSTAGKDAKDAKETDAAPGRTRKDSGHDLGDDAKAFFADTSYEAAYKGKHETFEDLTVAADDHDGQPFNKNLMIVSVVLVVAAIGVVAGLQIYRTYFGVQPATLPTNGMITLPETPPRPDPVANAIADSGSVTATNATVTEDAETVANVVVSDDTGSSVAVSTEEDSSVTTVAVVEDSGIPAVAVVEDSGVVVAIVNPNTAVVDSGVAEAPSGPAALLVAAQRARGTAAQAAAYQAYIDGGGTDGAAIARFAFALANRGDLGRAAEWAERATTLDPTSQLGWYVLGAAKLEGPRRDGAAARAAFRRCAALPGRYASDCRAGL